jgi:acyl carrier protein
VADIDSTDFLTLLAAINDRTGIEILFRTTRSWPR